MIRIKNKKKYGQHFLNNEKVAVRIVNLLSEKSNIIEIGSGKGVLTKYLLNKKIDNFIVNEIDNDCILYLKVMILFCVYCKIIYVALFILNCRLFVCFTSTPCCAFYFFTEWYYPFIVWTCWNMMIIK